MDEGQYKNWLAEQAKYSRYLHLSRWALRALPAALGWIEVGRASNAKLALFCLRATVATAVAGQLKTKDTIEKVLSKDFDFESEVMPVRLGREPVFGEKFTYTQLELESSGGNHSDISHAAEIAFYALNNRFGPAHAVGGDFAAFVPNVLKFAVSEAKLSDPEVFQTKLAEDTGPRKNEFKRGWNEFEKYSFDHPEWSFWREWYQGFLDGKPLDWELQKEIALIPDADWQKGPEWIADKIAEIRARFDLRQKINALEHAPVIAPQSRHGIGGNHPPEPLKDRINTYPELAIIWEPLQSLRRETETNGPDPSRIQKATDALYSALKKGAAWIAAKADLAVDTVIKWGIPATGTYLALNPEKLSAVIEAAQNWLKHLI